MKIVVDKDGKVVMWSDNAHPAPPAGGRVVELSREQAAAFMARKPSHDVSFDGEKFTETPRPEIPSIDLSNADNLEKTLKAVLLAAADLSGRTPNQARAAFAAAWRAL